MLSQGAFYMLISVVSFSITHACVKFLGHIPFFELVYFRAIISIFLSIYGLKKQNIPLFGKRRWPLFFRGLAGTIALCGYFYTLQVMPLATAVTVQYLSPIFTIIIATLFLKESARPLQWIYFFVAFIGVALVKGVDARVAMFPFHIGLAAAIGSGIAYNLVRYLRETEHPLVIVFYFPLVTVPLLTPLVIYYWVTPSWSDLPLILALGVFTQIAQVYMTKSYQIEKAANVSIFNYLGIVIAILVGWLGFSEHVTWLSAAGMSLIFFAVVMNSRIKRKL